MSVSQQGEIHIALWFTQAGDSGTEARATCFARHSNHARDVGNGILSFEGRHCKVFQPSQMDLLGVKYNATR